MAGTNVNISGAGFVHNAGFSVLNNSAVQEANQNQGGVTKFIIGSDSKSIEYDNSRENLMVAQQSPGTAMNLNENSQVDITDPTQIIYIQ